MLTPRTGKTLFQALLLGWVTQSVSLASSEKPASQTGPTSPNLIIFLTDDQGWGDLGCYGHPRIKSPHLDKFAREGLRLTQCYSACSVCSPSRSSLLTGRTPYRNGVWRWIPSNSQYYLRESEITIAEILREKGYDTCHVGKWHLNGKFNSEEQPQPDNHGYDHWMATQNNAAPHHLNPVNFVRNRKPVGRMEGPSSLICVQEAISWLQNRKDKSRPFFLTVWTHEPHLPIESAQKFMQPYSDISDEGIRQHHGNITQLDQAFGNLMNAVDEFGYRDTTFVFYTSDNGPEGKGTQGRTRGSTGGLRGRKRHTHEGGIRVPGIVRWPGKISPGTESNTPVIGSDVFSTLCDIVGQPLPADRIIDGASMLPLFDGKPIVRKQPLYWRNHLAAENSRVALRVGDWKIIGSDDLTSFELYNIARDEKETRNLSAEFPDRFETLREKLKAYDASVLADGPDWWKNDKPRTRKPGKSKKKLPRGIDQTGEFDVVLGGTLARADTGYQLTAPGEGLALKKVDLEGKHRFRLQTSYRSAQERGTTRNAAIAMGASPTNNATFKIGTGIGLGQHIAFPGGWQNVGMTRSIPGDFQVGDTFELVFECNLKTGQGTAHINGKEMKFKLPESIKEVNWIGFYVKNTSSRFGPLNFQAK
ncbi:MAG: sulfatase-like hydrolase/transferase [Planctomycetota bacterium]|nr:sulfatase-like hydrolase/transferase [Planctomycetota bacterium]